MATKFYLLQGVIVALHIENANYIEHYGLRRRVIKGKVDRTASQYLRGLGGFTLGTPPKDSPNYMLFKIQRHPDHHTNGRPTKFCEHFQTVLPYWTGYAGMFVLSWFPPLFWAVMDPLVERAYLQRAYLESKGVAASTFPKGSTTSRASLSVKAKDSLRRDLHHTMKRRSMGATKIPEENCLASGLW